MFNNVRDLADDIFCKLPPPTRSTRPANPGMPNPALHQTQGMALLPPGTLSQQNSFNGLPRTPGGTNVAAAADPDFGVMATYNDRDAGCLFGTCVVELQNGSKALVQNLVKGDIVRTGSKLLDGSDSYGRIVCVVRSVIENGSVEGVRMSDNCVLTSWHPVRKRLSSGIDNADEGHKWVFPADVKDVEKIPCECVYSLLIESVSVSSNTELQTSEALLGFTTGSVYAQSVVVDDCFECIALAHGIVDDEVAEHEFFGTSSIVKELSLCDGFADGLVTLLPGWTVRDAASKRVVGIDYKMVVCASGDELLSDSVDDVLISKVNQSNSLLSSI